MIETQILEIVKQYDRRFPIRRDDLLTKLHDRGVTITDREMRRICAEDLPICSSENGYYTPRNWEDMLHFKEYLMKKARPLFTRYERVSQAYLELIQADTQPDLFEAMK